VARSIDIDGPGLAAVLKGATEHKGSVFVEVFQNCPVFNDGAYDFITDKTLKAEAQLRMEHGKPLLFGKENKKGIRLNPATIQLEVVTLGENGITEKDILVHDAKREDPTLAYMLASLSTRPGCPTPVGIFRDVRRPTVDELTWEKIEAAKSAKKADLTGLLSGADTWTIG
jgi:2-oxoglutarate ferredoxin oxidoreductase subunit beta